MLQYLISMRKTKYREMAFAVAKQNNWIAHIETSIGMCEGSAEKAYGYFVAFKEEEIEECPHCHKRIFNSWCYDHDHYRCVDGRDNRYLSAHSYSEDVNEAWKALVERYCDSEKISVEQLALKLSVAGLI